MSKPEDTVCPNEDCGHPRKTHAYFGCTTDSRKDPKNLCRCRKSYMDLSPANLSLASRRTVPAYIRVPDELLTTPGEWFGPTRTRLSWNGSEWIIEFEGA